MSKPSYVYVTYIQTSPEKLWNALTDNEMTKLYWVNHRNVSDWKIGSEWRHEDYDDANLVDIVGKVIESKPPELLVMSWAYPGDLDKPEKVSKVTFKIDKSMGAVKLTLIHEELEPDSEMLNGISKGWPAVLSSLKTLLESGQPMPMTTSRWKGPLE